MTPLTPFDAPSDAQVGSALPELHGPVPGPEGQRLVDVLAAHECPAITARRARRADESGVDADPVVWERALGANVWDPDGNRFVDLCGGFGVVAAGHANPFVLDAVRDQLGRLVHNMGDAFPGRPRVELCAALARITPEPLTQVILGSSGSEAVEAAVKTAVLATGRYRVLGFEGSYHGLSLGILPASHYREPFREPFAGLTGRWASWLPYGAPEADIAAWLEQAAARGEAPAAILVEPIQGRGGLRVPPRGWLQALRRLADRFGALLIFDEIFTGFGRAGDLFQAGEASGVVPDLLCLGKGLASGFPLSACVGSREAMAAWGSSTGEAIHTSTFLGHPVATSAALAVIELVYSHGLVERAVRLGDHMALGLLELTEAHPDLFVGVRGRGAMRGLQVSGGRAMAICRRLLAEGYFLLPAGLEGDVLSFTPPFTLSRAQWDGAMQTLGRVARELDAGRPPRHRHPPLPDMGCAPTAERAVSLVLHERVQSAARLSRVVAQLHWSEKSFNSLALDLFKHQFLACEPYRSYCQGLGATPRTVRSWLAVPAVPTDVFRELDLCTFGPEELQTVFHTSGTAAGAPGRHLMRRTDTYEASALAWIQPFLFGGGVPCRVLVLAPPAAEDPHSSLSHMLQSVVDQLGDEGSGFYWDDGPDTARLAADLRQLAGDGRRLVLMGTARALQALVDDELAAAPVVLAEGSRVMETGGFKGTGGSRVELYAALGRALGVPPVAIVSEYGMTELASQGYHPGLCLRQGGKRKRMLDERPEWPGEVFDDDGVARLLVFPPWCRVRAVDPDTLGVLPLGRRGLLRFWDLANVDSISVIQSADVGTVYSDGVLLHGRELGATPRGCSLAVDEILQGSR